MRIADVFIRRPVLATMLVAAGVVLGLFSYRSLGVDLVTGDGLDAALEGVDAVVDAISSPPISPDETREYFAMTTTNLLAAEERAGVRHHVLLSIVGIHRMGGGTAHYSGKREQERLIEQGRVPQPTRCNIHRHHGIVKPAEPQAKRKPNLHHSIGQSDPCFFPQERTNITLL
jgi:nucleoside-diphosphate-sugar epimerase